jgi:superfamily II DNA helicase RecQ
MNKVKVFTLLWDDEQGGFDDSALTEFLEVRDVLDLKEQFFLHGNQPVWALMLTYRDQPEQRWPQQRGQERAGRAGRPLKSNPPDLEPQARPIYEALRRWRNDLAAQQGKPPYVLLDNKQLAEIARRRTTRAALTEIEGVGEGRFTLFGEALLEVLRAAIGAETPSTTPPQPPAQPSPESP